MSSNHAFVVIDHKLETSFRSSHTLPRVALIDTIWLLAIAEHAIRYVKFTIVDYVKLDLFSSIIHCNNLHSMSLWNNCRCERDTANNMPLLFLLEMLQGDNQWLRYKKDVFVVFGQFRGFSFCAFDCFRKLMDGTETLFFMHFQRSNKRTYEKREKSGHKYRNLPMYSPYWISIYVELFKVILLVINFVKVIFWKFCKLIEYGITICKLIFIFKIHLHIYNYFNQYCVSIINLNLWFTSYYTPDPSSDKKKIIQTIQENFRIKINVNWWITSWLDEIWIIVYNNEIFNTST